MFSLSFLCLIIRAIGDYSLVPIFSVASDSQREQIFFIITFEMRSKHGIEEIGGVVMLLMFSHCCGFRVAKDQL